MNPVCHTGADRHPYPCPSYRRRPASSLLNDFWIYPKGHHGRLDPCRNDIFFCLPRVGLSGIQYLLIFLVPGLRREDEEVTHYLFLDLP